MGLYWDWVLRLLGARGGGLCAVSCGIVNLLFSSMFGASCLSVLMFPSPLSGEAEGNPQPQIIKILYQTLKQKKPLPAMGVGGTGQNG